MSKNVREVVSKDSEDKEVKLLVRKPTAKQLIDARAASVAVVTKALGNNALTREQMADAMKAKGIFGEKEEKQLEELSKKIREAERQLLRGGITKEEGKKIAFQIQDWRREQLVLSFKSRELDQFTIQGQADNTEFNYLVSQCVFDENGNLYFSSLEDYLEKQEEPYAFAAAKALSEISNKVDEDYDKKLVENKFLVKYGFARPTDFALINEKGHLVDRDGKLINEDGRFVNEKGELVDRHGNSVDADGNPIEEFVEFT
jgi:hypothetical protein